jgi:hypothetical protein
MEKDVVSVSKPWIDKDSPISVPDVVFISHNQLYARTPEALKNLLAELERLGYDVKDCRKDEDRGASIETQEKNGWYLWYARLNKSRIERKAKCGSCGALIDDCGIFTHEHQCEACGAITYEKFRQGSTIRFIFTQESRAKTRFEPDLKMKIYGYDKESESLLLYAEPLNGNNLNDWNTENALKVLEANEHQFERRTVEDGTELIAINYDPWSHRVGVINTVEIFPSYKNAKIVNILDGKEFDEYARLPIPESYTIYEAWHWAPLMGASPNLHEKIMHAAGLVTRTDYYYQDGRPAFDAVHFNRMRKYVKYFTDINIDTWDAAIRRAPRSGPDFIRYLASCCQGVPVDQATYQEEANIGNVLVGLSKMMSGQCLTKDEKRMMSLGLTDETVKKDAIDLWKNMITAPIRKPKLVNYCWED